MSNVRHAVIEYLEAGAIGPEQSESAFFHSGLYPPNAQWHRFLNILILGLAVLCLSFSLLFFIAYNWQAIGLYAKFALVQLILIAATVVYVLRGTVTPSASSTTSSSLIGQGSLGVASLVTGVLLALYGQTYQTGADPWQLFITWAVLISPWVLIARFAPLWLLFFGLLNLSLMLWAQTFSSGFPWFGGGSKSVIWSFFAMNLIFLIAWEVIHGVWRSAEQSTGPSTGRGIVPRALNLAVGAIITILFCVALFERNEHFSPFILWPLWWVTVYAYYRYWQRDLFMLAGLALAGIVVSVALVIKVLPNNADLGVYLLLALMVVGLGSWATAWLRKLHREWDQV